MSKKLAIFGHETRSEEVVDLLMMLGGRKAFGVSCIYTDRFYYVSDEFECIHWDYDDPIVENKFEVFTLEKFLRKFPFKVGDFVRIPEYESEVRILKMKWCPVSEHIEYLVCPNDEEEWFTADELLEDNDNPTKTRDCKKCGLHFGSVRCFDKDCPHNTPKSYAVGLKDGKVIDNSIDSVQFVQSGKIVAVRFNTQNYENEVELQLDDYEIEIRDGKTYAVKKKPKYPTTYGECCEILDVHPSRSVDSTFITDLTDYEDNLSNLMSDLYKLRICRDAYWKIAGEELEMGEPWEPKFGNYIHYSINFYLYNDSFILHKGEYSSSDNRILVFPSEEMRDAFYDNFSDLIEGCKELL